MQGSVKDRNTLKRLGLGHSLQSQWGREQPRTSGDGPSLAKPL